VHEFGSPSFSSDHHEVDVSHPLKIRFGSDAGCALYGSAMQLYLHLTVSYTLKFSLYDVHFPCKRGLLFVPRYIS
jgi:hypothetical protein